ncbi:peptide chain release factor N(5)-glutamine methyltransferase [Chryseobacterium sp.]|uniref:peptide chain release factor N(5)-glutamine methyltransferase n=1 Tax=Chryseobacterium sp. TaxID=1871047 RepID=UPI0011C82DFC|nr:peptide chain release factor N(5)-glutamine methyltransferase [Chryseobacterium sp.]TXF78957.1 peptide chain release factor N(5)-glutamine methyltransferase [Chryseobacterium sp.]
MTLTDLKQKFQEGLSELYNESESLELFFIFVENILETNRFESRNSLQKELEFHQQEQFNEIITELQSGKPYQQILGETEFYGLKFFVDENVLIPRPETEELVELAIKKSQESRARNQESITENLPFKILDIGTGSGIIPITLQKHFPEAEITAIDFSEKALKTAKKNADFHQTEVHFILQNYLTESLNDIYDVIISNPPYIGIDEEKELEDSVKDFEPKMALFSPTSDALIFYRKIAEDSKNHLQDGGMIFLEINQKLGKETLELFRSFKSAELIQDLSGNDRFIFAVK